VNVTLVKKSRESMLEIMGNLLTINIAKDCQLNVSIQSSLRDAVTVYSENDDSLERVRPQKFLSVGMILSDSLSSSQRCFPKKLGVSLESMSFNVLY
jgi:hypothetical protein